MNVDERPDEETTVEIEKYSEDSFWDKIGNFAKVAGNEVVEKAFTAYYCAMDTDTPVKAKATIYGALAYFITPLEIVPDFVPITGYADDAGVLIAALAFIAVHVKDVHKEKAKDQANNIFG